ncbi:MAG: hypothetical protein OXJ64_17460, partial [Boseongicola sp.]|nr:hypothetical protein [Boseongicola sp.]
MSKSSYNQMIQSLDRVRAALEPLSAIQRAIDREKGIRDVIETASRSHQSLRPMLGPVEDLRRSLSVDATAQIAAELASVRAMIARIEESYRLPVPGEALCYLHSQNLQALRTFERSVGHTAAFQRIIDSLTTPWMDTTNALGSIAGLCELQGIGRLVQDAATLAPEPAGRLRCVLGDWRAPIDWPAPIFTDPFARSEFYLDRGLDPALTEFPAAAFDQIVTATGLKDTVPSLVPDHSPNPDSHESDEDAGFVRNNVAHDRLQRFETHMRRFIERKMHAAFGHAWIKRRVPPDIRSDWKRKSDEARERGEPDRSLIAYADFTDYERIIMRGDNWRDVFK